MSWESVCTPKASGGLGLRRLEASNTVFGLKLIWLLFAGTGSLWVAWIREHLIVDRNFLTGIFGQQISATLVLGFGVVWSS